MVFAGFIQLMSNSYQNSFNIVSPVLTNYLTDEWCGKPNDAIWSMPLMRDGLWMVLLIMSLYLYFVKILGPKMMANRKAYHLKGPILAHNILLAVFNCYFFCFAVRNSNYGYDFWKCSPLINRPNTGPDYILWVIWFYVMSKFVDLLDTVFFVLRKKFNHVSHLHVIHHTIVPINFYLAFKYGASINMAFLPFVNSFVHTLMYSYYALAALGPSYRPYLWWKKYLTSLQIGQFILVAINFVWIATRNDCNIPKVMFIIGLPQVLLIMALFVSFYLKTYLHKNNDDDDHQFKVKPQRSRMINGKSSSLSTSSSPLSTCPGYSPEYNLPFKSE